jgi:hypothetical protein
VHPEKSGSLLTPSNPFSSWQFEPLEPFVATYFSAIWVSLNKTFCRIHILMTETLACAGGAIRPWSFTR